MAEGVQAIDSISLVLCSCSTSKVGQLFMTFEAPSRLRVQGYAQLTDDSAIVGLWPGAQFAGRVEITSLITNCPRHILRMRREQGSRYVPDAHTGQQPIPGWKRIDAIQGVLRQRDQGQAGAAGGLITMHEWGRDGDAGRPAGLKATSGLQG